MTVSAQISSIEVHHIFPFVRIGLAFDLDPALVTMDPCDHVVDRGDWWIEIAGEIQGCAYSSRGDALDDVEERLFAEWNARVVKEQIERSLSAGDVALAMRLAEARGQATGRRMAGAQFAAALTDVDHILWRFKAR